MSKCCTFAGYSTTADTLKSELIVAVTDLIDNKGVSTFYVGNHGRFDALSASAFRTVKQNRNENKLILVVPKMRTTLENNKEYFADMYDEVLIPAELDAAHYKAMITVRNRWMVDSSDYIITYIRKEHGGVYNTYKYAEKKDTEIIEL
ncbi:MAG: DUF1273 domain-containing protein [Clostridia bacterium]|nr:DUF1273 domain-containing protein [Clostridia bacterium]